MTASAKKNIAARALDYFKREFAIGEFNRPSLGAHLDSISAKGSLDFQIRVNDWMQECFGSAIALDINERNHRFLEESIELVQSLGCTPSEAHQLVDYVFNRPVGVPEQETGGVMVTLAALCNASRLNMHKEGENELDRILGCVEKIRAKQAAKPAHSPLPDAPAEMAVFELADLLREVSSKFTRDDDLPNDLLARIDNALERHGV